MEFVDKYEEDSFKYMLDHVFHHVPAGLHTSGEFKGEPYDEYWWRETAEADDAGTRGYVTVWFDSVGFSSSHGYRHPEANL